MFWFKCLSCRVHDMSFATYITPQQSPFSAEYLDIFITGFTYMFVPLYTWWHSNLFGCFLTHHMVCLEQLSRVWCSCMKMQRKVIIHTETEGEKCTEIHWALCSMLLNLKKHLEDSWYHTSLVEFILSRKKKHEEKCFRVDCDLLCCYLSLP